MVEMAGIRLGRAMRSDELRVRIGQRTPFEAANMKSTTETTPVTDAGRVTEVKDQRSWTRKLFDGELKAELWPDDGGRYAGTAVDVSLGGMAIRLEDEHAPDVGSLVQVALNGGAIFEAIVRYVDQHEDGQCRVGLEWSDASAEGIYQLIRRLLDM